jgi:hypothetical protein
MQLLALLLAALPAALAIPTEGFFAYADADAAGTAPVTSRSEAGDLTRRAAWCDIDGGSAGLGCYRSPCKDGYLVGKFYYAGRFEFSCWKDGGYDHDS